MAAADRSRYPRSRTLNQLHSGLTVPCLLTGMFRLFVRLRLCDRYGSVWRCTEVDSGKIVAIKRFKAANNDEEVGAASWVACTLVHR